jgi:hypothetical protein
VQSAALPLRLLLRLHPALAAVILQPLLVAQQGLLRSAACSPLLLLLLQET